MKNKEEDLAEVTRREFLYWAAMGAAGMTLAGLPGLTEGAEKKPKYGGRLRMGGRFASAGLDAHKNQFFPDFMNYLLMYNALMIMGPYPQVRVYPDVGKSYKISPDGREYTFSLQEKVKFHHGKELDSGDVKYSIERVMNPVTRSPRAFAYRWIDSIQILDKYHLTIRLKEPFGPFLTTLTIQHCPIIPAGWEPTPTKPAPGTGPFVFKSFVPNETIELTRFDQYWEYDEKTGNRLPYLDGFYLKKIVDEMVRWTALRAGDVDLIHVPPRNIVLQEVREPTPGIVTIVNDPTACDAIIFNTTKPPYDHKKVRQAFAFGIDKKEMVKAAYWGLAEALNNQPFSNRCWMYIPVQDREADLDRAKKLLAEAGHPNGFKTEILTFSDVTRVEGTNAVVGQLKKIGIDTSIRIIDRAPFYDLCRKGEYSIAFRGDSERLDPDDAYYPWFHSSEINKNNWSRYTNKEMDGLLESGRTLWKWEDRMPVYKKIVEIVKEDLPILYLAKPINPSAWRDNLQGYAGGASTWLVYYGGGMKYAWFDK